MVQLSRGSNALLWHEFVSDVQRNLTNNVNSAFVKLHCMMLPIGRCTLQSLNVVSTTGLVKYQQL